MTGLEIALFVLAAAFIVISFFITGNNEKVENNRAKATNAPDTKELQALGARIITDVKEKADTVLLEAEDSMEKLSNEKILAIDEYSGQVVEKIDANHREVVFLYQMLQDKEEELKATAARLDSARIKCEQLLRTIDSANAAAAIEAQAQAELENRMLQQDTHTLAGNNTEMSANSRQASVRKVEQIRSAFRDNTPEVSEITDSSSEKAAVIQLTPKTKVSEIDTDKKTGKPAGASVVGAVKTSSGTRKNSNPYISKTKIEKPDFNDETGITEKNKEIIALYKKKKSVLEISKLLGMGQGEVRLIIDLYCKN